MKTICTYLNQYLLSVVVTLLIFATPALAEQQLGAQQRNNDEMKIVSAKKISTTEVEILLANNQKITLDFYADHIVRFFQDSANKTIRNPDAKPAANILVENPRIPVINLMLVDESNMVTVSTKKIRIQIDRNNSLIKIINLVTNTVVLEQKAPVLFDKKGVTLTFKEQPQEYFYGGGVQNGRFSHKGKIIAIENQNRWTDGGVASPTPFYWSTNGYGVMWHTFKKGKYDFGYKEKGIVKLTHETDYLDVFFIIDNGAVPLLKGYYQLTGNPVLLPKFGFYEGHLNAYNRDFWKEDTTGILFEDGKRYKESQRDSLGIKESLNGEKDNYLFSARAVIDRYKKNDMPFGWILPNDGYGAGYGQTSTLEGNVQNLKKFGDYARKNGVEIGLWTQSDLYPKPEINALLQRDILQEVKEAGVRVLKTDVAWVGAGYSFGLNGVSDVAQIMSKHGSNARPFIISLDGWAGTQRYAAVWTGDQTGSLWEYIRFHIPTYIGAGLSGLSNITSDMDGIFGGKNHVVNTRDFQWKTFSPMQLNMDGWGTNPKYPHILGEPTASINRNYLKLKSELMPYAYSIAKEAVTGLPMIRPLFLEYPNAYTNGTATQYQFLYGPNFLVAPIYQATKSDEKGNDIRNGIYLPKGIWIDYFTGEKYTGNRIINNFDAPIWKLPVFVKSGAIIPITNPNNNVGEINKKNRIYEIYPAGKTSFTEYDDDGVTEQYKAGKGSTTLIESFVKENTQTAIITIHPTKGDFDGFVKEKTTEFRINVSKKPKSVKAKRANKEIGLTEVKSLDAFLENENVYYYNAAPNLNRFATKGSEFEKKVIVKNPQVWIKIEAIDITKSSVVLTIEGLKFESVDSRLVSKGLLVKPTNALITDKNTEAYILKPTWQKVNNADYYEIDFNGMRYSTIMDTTLLFEGLTAETPYSLKLRAVNKDGYSDWVEMKATTKANPLKFAIQEITAETKAENQRGFGTDKLFDYDETNLWQTRRGAKAVPFEMVIDLKSVNQLDKIHYLPPRLTRSTVVGLLLKGKVFYSNNKNNWVEADRFEWANNDEVKVFSFPQQPSARYIKIAVTEATGDAGAGRELYVFKVPGTETYLQGDINHDGLIDKNDFTSYLNYTGLRKGDADFEGYISKGDINQNGLIDAYDISVVATQLDAAIDNKTDTIAGRIEMSTTKLAYEKDEIVEIRIKGIGLKSINALGFSLPYNSQDYEFTSVQPLNMKEMQNLTYDRLHTNGTKALYATFVNLGHKEKLTGDMDMFVIKLKAKRSVQFNLKVIDGVLVNKNLLTVEAFE